MSKSMDRRLKIQLKCSIPEPKNPMGYTRREILDIIRPIGIHHNTFWKKFGVNTCGVGPNGESLMYPCDVELAIRCCIEGRDKTVAEWD